MSVKGFDLSKEISMTTISNFQPLKQTKLRCFIPNTADNTSQNTNFKQCKASEMGMKPSNYQQ